MIRDLLDTDHARLHERGHPPLLTRLAALPPESIAVSVVTVEEAIRGRLAIRARRSIGEALVHAHALLSASEIDRVGFMIRIQFDDLESKRQALGRLAGRYSFKSWAGGAMLVPEDALGYLAVEGIAFRVEGPATSEQNTPALRGPAPTSVQ